MPEVNSAKFYVTAGWEDVAHLDEKTKMELEASTPPHLRASRMRGEPSLGAGAVYQVSPDEFRISPIPIPDYFRRGYGFDPGWNRTAAIWGAHDVDNDIIYLIGEHYVGQQPPAVHAAAIKARGEWQSGQADYAGSSIDGKKVIDEYRKLGLNLINADKAVEAGIQTVLDRLTSGRLKVFSTLTNWFDEYRFYIRDEKTGKVKKTNDHLMDATRYLIMGLGQMKTRPMTSAAMPFSTFHAIDERAGY